MFFDTLWNGVCVSSLVNREKPQRGSLKKLKQRSTHCENILYQGHRGNKGRRMLGERWTVLEATEKMTHGDTYYK